MPCVIALSGDILRFIKLLLTFLLNGLNEKEKIFQGLSIIIVICIKYEQCAASVAILSVHLQRLWQKYFARSPHNECYSYNQLAQSCRVRLCSKPFKQYVSWARARAWMCDTQYILSVAHPPTAVTPYKQGVNMSRLIQISIVSMPTLVSDWYQPDRIDTFLKYISFKLICSPYNCVK